MLLGRGPDVEGGDVDELRPHADVALPDEDPRVVDRLGEALLVDLGLKAALQQLLRRQLQDGVQLQLVVGQQAVPAHPAEEGRPFEDPLGVLGVERQEGPRRLSQLGQRVLDPPDLALAPEPVLAHELQLGIQALLLEGPAGRLVGFAVCGGRVGNGGEGQEANERGMGLASSSSSRDGTVMSATFGFGYDGRLSL